MNIEESESLDDPIPLSDPALDAAPEFGPVDTTEIPLVVVAIAQPPEPTSHEEFPVMEPISLEEIEPIPLADHASTPEIIDAVRLLGDRIDRRLTDLQASFDREVRAEVSREKVIDRLHSELQDYKQDLLLNTLRPIFIDLIQLHDDIGKVAVLPNDPSPDSSRFVELMLGFQEGIEDILYRQGVEPYRNDGDLFDPRRQRAVTTVPTDDPSLVKSIAARHRKGFQSGDRVIRPEIVSVHALKK